MRKNYRLMRRMRAVPRLCDLYPGIFLTIEKKARKNLSQGSRTFGTAYFFIRNWHKIQ